MRKLFPALLFFVCLACAQVARADNFTFSSNNFNQPGSLGTVTTTLVGSNILVSVNINPAYVIHGAGIGMSISAGFTVTSITNIVSDGGVFTPDLGSHQFDGFGSFAPSVVSNQSAAQARASGTNTVSFQVNGNFTNANQIFQFAAQLAPLDANNPNTGFAVSTTSGGPPPPPPPPPGVPEPASLVLLGTGLISGAGWIRKKRNSV